MVRNDASRFTGAIYHKVQYHHIVYIALKAGFHMIANDHRRSQRKLFPYNIIADDRKGL